MLNSKLTLYCSLLAFVLAFGNYVVDTESNDTSMPIFCSIYGNDSFLNSLHNSEFDANLCDYILVIGTVNTTNWTIELKSPAWEETLADDMSKLKAVNNDLKFMISVTSKSQIFSILAFKHHIEFASNAKSFIREYKFDGIHINWEHPDDDYLVYILYDENDNEDTKVTTTTEDNSNQNDVYANSTTEDNSNQNNVYFNSTTEDNSIENYAYSTTENNSNEKDTYVDLTTENSLSGKEDFVNLTTEDSLNEKEDFVNSTREADSDEYDEIYEYGKITDVENDTDSGELYSPGKVYFLRLIQELKSQLKEDGSLVAITITDEAYLHRSYDFKNLKEVVDYWFIKGMGYNEPPQRPIKPNAPIRTDDPEYGVKALVDEAKKNIGPNYKKIVLSVPFYGVFYTLKRRLKDDQNPFEKTPKLKIPQKYLTPYGSICSLAKLARQNDRHVFYNYNTTTESPYAVMGRGLFLYEDPRSIRAKTNLAISEGLGGVMAFFVDMDEIKGNCSCPDNIKYPLLRSIYDTIHLPSSENWKNYQECL